MLENHKLQENYYFNVALSSSSMLSISTLLSIKSLVSSKISSSFWSSIPSVVIPLNSDFLAFSDFLTSGYLELEVGNWSCKLGLEIEFGIVNRKFEFGNWKYKFKWELYLELEVGIGCWNWMCMLLERIEN